MSMQNMPHAYCEAEIRASMVQVMKEDLMVLILGVLFAVPNLVAQTNETQY